MYTILCKASRLIYHSRNPSYNPQQEKRRLCLFSQYLANLAQPIFGTRKAIFLQYLYLYLLCTLGFKNAELFCIFLLLNVYQMKTNVLPDRPNAMKKLNVLTQLAHMTALVKTDTPGMDSFVQVRK